MWYLGYCHENAIGLVEDLKIAEFWYERGYAAGDFNCAFALGTFYEHALTGVKDNIKALSLYQQAAQTGHAKANYNAGILLYWGDGPEQDIDLAYNYFKVAADNGHGTAKFLMGQALLSGGAGLEKNVTAGARYLLEASQQGIIEAHDMIGYCYLTGQGVEIDLSKSIYHSQIAAEKGGAWSQFRLAHALIERNDEKADLYEAVKWLTISFNQPEEAGEKRHELIISELQHVKSLLSDEDFEEACQQFQ